MPHAQGKYNYNTRQGAFPTLTDMKKEYCTEEDNKLLFGNLNWNSGIMCMTHLIQCSIIQCNIS